MIWTAGGKAPHKTVCVVVLRAQTAEAYSNLGLTSGYKKGYSCHIIITRPEYNRA